MANILLSELETSVQNGLRNTIGTPITQSKRVDAYNQVIDRLQSEYNWNTTKRVTQFDYLQGETDYSIVDDLGISDFKSLWDIRFPDEDKERNIEEFEDIGEKVFNHFRSRDSRINRVTIEERDNVEILRILANAGSNRIVVHNLDSLTADGTWASETSSSDATTLAADTTKKVEGAASLKFNIDVSQSGNDYAEISTTTVLTTTIDATDLENIGVFRFWLGLHSVSAANLALITSVTLRFGSSSSDYWEVTSTTPVNNGSFKAGWNRMSFNWANATSSGSPDSSALDYFLIRITYSSGFTDSNNIRVDELVLLEPTTLEMVYFSTNMVNDPTDGWQVHFSVDTVDTTQQLLLPKRYTRAVIKLALAELFPQKEKNDADYIRVTQEGNDALESLANELGNSIVREQETLRPAGQMSGRVESRMW